ncbi:hypothetical protein RRF55_27840, partial [Klebsiella sp. K47]|uniref:hypothetical protein n=1 Tax=Klebsiella sp. K47 TaxID=3077736 RepID=UPI003F447AFA
MSWRCGAGVAAFATLIAQQMSVVDHAEPLGQRRQPVADGDTLLGMGPRQLILYRLVGIPE